MNTRFKRTLKAVLLGKVIHIILMLLKMDCTIRAPVFEKRQFYFFKMLNKVQVNAPTSHIQVFILIGNVMGIYYIRSVTEAVVTGLQFLFLKNECNGSLQPLGLLLNPPLKTKNFNNLYITCDFKVNFSCISKDDSTIISCYTAGINNRGRKAF